MTEDTEQIDRRHHDGTETANITIETITAIIPEAIGIAEEMATASMTFVRGEEQQQVAGIETI